MNYFKPYFAFTGCFIFIFICIHMLHFHLLNVAIILYTLLLDIVLSTIIALVVLRKKEKFLVSIAMVTFVLSATLYSILLPTMVERSLSVQMLRTLYDTPQQKISIAKLNEELIGSYMIEKRLY